MRHSIILALKIKNSDTFNKIDIRTDDDPLQDFRADHVLQISAAEMPDWMQ